VRLIANGLPALLAASQRDTSGFAQRARMELVAIARSGGEADTPAHQV